MYCINYHCSNHNVETCKSKKEEPILAITKATTQAGKPPNPILHICGIVGHKLTNCPRFGEMQSMFKGKRGQSIKFKLIAKAKMVTTLVKMVDVNATIRNKTSEEQV